MLRVDFAKLDRLMNLVGELVLDKANFGTNLQQLSAIAAGMASGRKRIAGVGRDSGRAISRAEVRALAEELAKLEQNFETLEQEFSRTSQRLDNVTGDLRDQVMQLRMVPIGTVFRRFGVRVRELAIRHEKDVRLELVGEHTELDRMLVDHIDAPLLHLVTNAVYHGIETSAERVAAGKDPQGLLRLRAFQQGNQIVIEVHDDGGGIDPSVIRTIASERGIRSAEELAAMDDKEVLVLIMDPRLSGVLQVDEDAGRGVGMTVVWKTIITGLKGSIDIDSTVGVGTTFTLKLPLTLAIIQVVLLRAGAETVAMPLDLVTRTLTCSPEDIRHVCDREVLQLGDRQVPLVRLAQAIGAASVERPGPHHQDSTPASLQRHVILVDLWGQTYGLLCDRLVGKQEVVIKSLGDLLEEVPGVAGATLLRDRCVVILDIPVIIDRASHASYDALSPAVADQGGGRAQSSVPRILVVDDSDMTRESIKRLLEDEGYQVSSAVDGEDALRLAQEGHFDLISTDAMMPNMDGYELTRALRAEPRHRDTPIMMVTSRDQTADRVLGFDAGVDAYLTKPFNRSELLEIVAVHLRRASPTTEAEAQ
ncbi:MAG: hypothetical protein DRI90_22240 [Deltaproteobacteria bacterium]|nr:MAG: hypothetical protein DRI90_22240 [Deltaproteobacteria bacterium]